MKLYHVAVKASQIGKEDHFNVDKVSSKNLKKTLIALVGIMFPDGEINIENVKKFSLEVIEVETRLK